MNIPAATQAAVPALVEYCLGQLDDLLCHVLPGTWGVVLKPSHSGLGVCVLARHRSSGVILGSPLLTSRVASNPGSSSEPYVAGI